MALTKEVINDKIEVVGVHKHIGCRVATIIKEDGVELSRSYNRYVLYPDSDISGESQEIQNVCNLVWTDEVKATWATQKAKEADPTPE